MPTYAAVTGRITIPGTELGIRAKVTAEPLTTDGALSFADRVTWGPRTVETDAAGNMPAGASALQIPLASTLGAEVIWRFTADPIDRLPHLKKWVIAEQPVTGATTIQALAAIGSEVTAVSADVAAKFLDSVATAVAAATTAAASATSAAASASAASTVAGLTGEDDTIALLTTDASGSDTAAALRAKIDARAVVTREAPLSPYRYGLTDAMQSNQASATAVAAAFQAAVNAMPGSQGSLLIPKGEFFCTGGIMLQGKHFDVFGYGEQSSALRFVDHTGTAPPMFHVLADTAPHYAAGSFSGFTIGFAAGVSAGNPGPAIRVEGAWAADVLIHNMWIGGSVGIHYKDAPNCKAWDCVIEGTQGSGIYAEGAKLLELNGIQTFQCNGSGIDLYNCAGVTITAGKMVENYQNGVFASGSSKNIKVLGTLFDNNSKQFAFNPAAPGYATYDNIRFTGVNEGAILGTQHVMSLGSPFTRRGVSVDSASFNVEVLGGVFPAANFVDTEVSNQAAGSGSRTIAGSQLYNPGYAAFGGTISVGGLYLRNNAGVLEKSTNNTTWSAV